MIFRRINVKKMVIKLFARNVIKKEQKNVIKKHINIFENINSLKAVLFVDIINMQMF